MRRPHTGHPRAGGERSVATAMRRRPGGPSPRGRGTRPVGEFLHLLFRAIPARAGNARASTAAGLAAGGPSPRGRGTRRRRPYRTPSIRAIPARAGNARPRRAPWRARPGHPRAGGERPPQRRRGRLDDGPSPRGRGTLPPRTRRAKPSRAIPARAGNAPGGSTTAAHTAGHPRAGGERQPKTRRKSNQDGPSPRGRGTPPAYVGDEPPPRAIPARAGNARPAVGTPPP